MTRLAHAWRTLEREQRLAALAAIGLFVSMFLPWYSKADTFVEHGSAKATQTSLSAFQAFSFVEAAVLLVSAGVLAMLFTRAEERDFQLPGGDGLIVMVAGAWAALLIFYRLLDKPGLQASQRITATVGVEWGIFIALLLALGLLYAGGRMRAEERPEPPLMRRGSRRPRPTDPDEAESWRVPADEAATALRRSASEHATRPARVGGPVPARPPGPDREPPQDAASADTSATRPPSPPPSASGRRSGSGRPRFPPAPSEQMSFEDQPTTPGE
jgi:hypothetical protein